MEEDEADTPTSWPHASGGLRRDRRRDSSSYALLLLLLLAASVAFVIFVVPPFLGLSSRIFRPHSVKRSWDSLNLVLVLFAIVCGFLGRSKPGGDEGSSPGSYPRSDSRKSSSSNPATPYKWYDNYDRPSSDRSEYGFSSSSSGRMRISSSYPDLRAQDSPWAYAEERRRFYDDTHLLAGRGFGSAPVYSRRRWNEEDKKFETKRVVVDDTRDRTAAVEEMEVPVTPPPSAPPPPPPPPVETLEPSPLARAAGNKRKKKRTYETVAQKPKYETDKPPAAPPPPPPPPVFHPMEEKSGKKRGGSATKEFLSSLKMKRKKQRQKSIENLESFLASQPLPSSSRLPPPPPPPPPPPSVLRTLFTSKKGKTRKAIPAPPPPPPAPPPPPTAQRKTEARPSAFSQSTANLITMNRSHTSVTATLNYESSDDNINSGGLSPLIPIPPPPPPPPFKVQPWKFAVRGDYVRIKSTNSWRHHSPDTEDDEGNDEASVSGTTESPSNASSGATSPAFCPSPDVDTKADNFIARFRAGLSLEKMNSMKQRRSNLAPERTG